MGFGNISGGSRIVRTMGHLINTLTAGGFAAETAGAARLVLATEGGLPVELIHKSRVVEPRDGP